MHLGRGCPWLSLSVPAMAFTFVETGQSGTTSPGICRAREKRKSPECLAAPLQRCPVLQCPGSEDVGLNFSMEKRLVNPAKPDMLSHDTFVYLRK